MSHNKQTTERRKQPPKELISPNPAERSTSSSRVFNESAGMRGYHTFRTHPAEYSGRTKPFFSHTIPTRVVSKPQTVTTTSTTLLTGPVPFNVCGCEEEDLFTASNLVQLPSLRGCPECHPTEEEAPPSSKGSSTHTSPRQGSSLPRSEPRLPPLTWALHSMGRDTAEYRAAVEAKIPPFPFTQHLSPETREAIKEYLRVCHAAYLFNYLSLDLLKDKPARPVEYIIEWLKARRALHGK